MLKLVTMVLGVTVGLVVLVASAVSGVVAAVFSSGGPGAGTEPSPAAMSDIPGDYLAVYQQAAPTCPGLDWSVLAGIGKIETNHGRLNAPGVHNGENSSGAGGAMQFLQPTFASVVRKHPIPPGGAQPPSRYDPHDAIHAAASYLCDGGARDNRDLRAAIYQYNHADWYVRQVLDQATAYRGAQQAQPAMQAGWMVPTNGRCSSGFGTRSGEVHKGQDIAAPIGTPIVAASSGTVVASGPASGYGLWIRIQHPDGTVTTYGHNHRNHVQQGDHVQAGQPIAEVGNRGQTTGPHLHFQVDVNGQPTDPARFYREHGAPDLCS